MIDELCRLVEQLEEDRLLCEPDQLRRRLDALDLLDACFPDCLAGGPGAHDASDSAKLCRRVNLLRAQMEAANEGVYEGIRAEILRGGRSESLWQWARLAAQDAERGGAGGLGYGFLDELVSGVFRLAEPVGEPIPSGPEMVAYQPTPARHIFELIHQAGLTANDVLVDLGSGLGHVPLLVSVCTGARSIGIELDASYVERATQCAFALNLARVSFRNEDARRADLSAGTVYYLYTPFTGSILRSVIDRLRREALGRPIRICTYGPVTPRIAQERWLEAMSTPDTHRVTQFRSRS